MSSLSDSQEDSFSYEGESDMVEDLFLGNRKSSPVVLSRRESVFLAESSFSSSEGHGSQQTSEGSVQEDNKTSLIARENIAESEHLTIDEGQEHYSDWFESTSASERSSDARFQDTISLKDESILHTEENKRKDSFIMKKLALLIPGCNPHNNGKSYEDKILYGKKEMSDFCFKKIQLLISMERPKGKRNLREVFLTSKKQHVHQSVVGRKAKIESLKIENFMNKMEKIKQSDFHIPSLCSDCRTVMSNNAKREFLKRKLEIVKRQEFEDRLQTHLYQKDSVSLIAEITRSCTKPTASTREVWKKLLQNGEC